MTIRVTVLAPDKLDLAEELRAEFFDVAEQAVEAAADLLLADVKRRLTLRHGTAKTAAPPGEPPESDTGALAASFKRLPARRGPASASSGILSRHPGGNRLEFGFTDVRGIRTFTHPFIRPAMVEMEAPIGKLLQDRLG